MKRIWVEVKTYPAVAQRINYYLMVTVFTLSLPLCLSHLGRKKLVQCAIMSFFNSKISKLPNEIEEAETVLKQLVIQCFVYEMLAMMSFIWSVIAIFRVCRNIYLYDTYLWNGLLAWDLLYIFLVILLNICIVCVLCDKGRRRVGDIYVFIHKIRGKRSVNAGCLEKSRRGG